MASCWQGEERPSVPICSGSGTEEDLISSHPEGGSHVQAVFEYVLIRAHMRDSFACMARCLNVHTCFFDGCFNEEIKTNLLECTGEIFSFDS